MIACMNSWTGIPASRTSWLLGLLFTLTSFAANGQGRDASELLRLMTDSFGFPPNASMALKVQSNGSWRNAPEAEEAPYSGVQTDHWRITSDSERFGRELRRETLSGLSQTRVVIHSGRVWTFQFDTSAPPETEIVGRMLIRGQSFRGTRWRMPLTEYFDRAFMFSGRFFEDYQSLEVADAMELIDGHPCYVVEGEWNDREFTFWLDPEFGHLPRKYAMRLTHTREVSFGSRGGPRLADRPVIAPPALQAQLDRPIMSDERLSSVVLKNVGGTNYIASAILEKTQTYADDISRSEQLTFETSDFALSTAPDTDDFLKFAGLLRDGTPAEETVGGRLEPTTVNYFVFKDGVLVPSSASTGSYFRDLWIGLKALAADFSLENIRRLDSMVLVAVCAGAALLINGTMAYAAYRKKRPKGPAPE